MPRNPNIKRFSNAELSKKSSLDAYFWGGITIIGVGIAFNYTGNTNSVGLVLMVAGLAIMIFSNIRTELLR